MEKLALTAGIEYSQISNIEHGKIAKALDIAEKDLFDFHFEE